MQITAACTLITAIILAGAAANEQSLSLVFPAAAAAFFGIGNAIVAMERQLISPAVVYGLGYTAQQLRLLAVWRCSVTRWQRD